MARALVLLLTWGLSACSDPADPRQQPPPDTTPDPLPLREVALARGLRIGTAVDRLLNDTQFRTVAAREFNALTAENDMKHQRLQPARGVFQFARADSIVAFAQANQMQVRGHTLVWHNQNASWLTSGSWTEQEATELLQQHIATVVDHFEGRVVAWDVVNEAFNDDGTRRTTFWSSNVGSDYIDLAFHAARAADPQALLFYNDYNIEGINAKSDSVYAMISSMKQGGVPIDGIGFQGHFVVGALPARQSMLDNIARFAALGLEVHFTELDIRMQLSAPQLTTQADNYRTVFDVCLQSTACKMVVLWGLTDKESWIPSVFPGWGDALLFDALYNRKPAYWQVHSLLAGT